MSRPSPLHMTLTTSPRSTKATKYYLVMFGRLAMRPFYLLIALVQRVLEHWLPQICQNWKRIAVTLFISLVFHRVPLRLHLIHIFWLTFQRLQCTATARNLLIILSFTPYIWVKYRSYMPFCCMCLHSCRVYLGIDSGMAQLLSWPVAAALPFTSALLLSC